MDDVRISPAGDPFYAAAIKSPRGPDQKEEYSCPVCYAGVVYLGEVVEGEDGEEVEQIEAVSCKRCRRD
jgi:hypothetical protein